MSTEFASSGGTRNIEAGDTPGLDYLGVSVAMADENISKGTKCWIINGLVTTTLVAGSENTFPLTPCVPTESIDNSGGDDLEIRVILPNQTIALTAASDFTVGQYGEITGIDTITQMSQTAVNTLRKYARYIGKEAAIFSIDGTTPFDQTLSTGIVPDQSLASGEVGWFMLVESAL